MKKQIRRRRTQSDSVNKRPLSLARETVKTLTSDELAQVPSGCPTGDSWTTLNGGTNTCA